MPGYEAKLTDKFEKLIKAIQQFAIENNPALAKPENKNFLDNLTLSALKLVYNAGGENDKGLSERKLDDPHIMKHLAESVALAATASKEMTNAPELTSKLDDILKLIKNAFEKNPEFKKQFDALLKKDLQPDEKNKEFEKLLKKFLEPSMLAKMQKMLKDVTDSLLNKTQKAQDPSHSQEMKSPGNDLYQNLFGLISSSQTGGYQIPIPQYIGNGFGFNDWNPYDGSAPIDYQNSLNDTQFGDSLGLNAATARNYLSVPETNLDSFKELLESCGLEAPDTAPKPNPFGTSPFGR